MDHRPNRLMYRDLGERRNAYGKALEQNRWSFPAIQNEMQLNSTNVTGGIPLRTQTVDAPYHQ